MRVKKRDPIPTHIRQFCEGELRLYPLRSLEYVTALQKREVIREEGGDRSFDLAGAVSGGFLSSPVAAKLERMEQVISQRDVLINQHCCSLIEGVIGTLTDREYEVLEAYYWRRLTPDLIESELSIHERTQRRIRNEIVTRLAIAWSMM